MLLTVGKEAINVAFVRPSVCSSVAYIANNSRTQKPVGLTICYNFVTVLDDLIVIEV